MRVGQRGWGAPDANADDGDTVAELLREAGGGSADGQVTLRIASDASAVPGGRVRAPEQLSEFYGGLDELPDAALHTTKPSATAVAVPVPASPTKPLAEQRAGYPLCPSLLCRMRSQSGDIREPIRHPSVLRQEAPSQSGDIHAPTQQIRRLNTRPEILIQGRYLKQCGIFSAFKKHFFFLSHTTSLTYLVF
jgi:hypothetical protein